MKVDTRRTTIAQGFDDSYFTRSWATRPIRPLQDTVVDIDNQDARQQHRTIDTYTQPVRLQHRIMDTEQQPVRQVQRTIDIEHEPVRQEYKTIDIEDQPVRTQHKTIYTDYQPIRQHHRTIDTEHQHIRQEHRTIDTEDRFRQIYTTLHPDYQTKRYQHKRVDKDRRRPMQDARPLQEYIRPIQDVTPTQDDRSIQEIPKENVRQMLQDDDDIENRYARPTHDDIDDSDLSNPEEGETVDADRAERFKDFIDKDYHRPIRPTKFKPENKDPHLVIPIQDEIVDSDRPSRLLQEDEEQKLRKTTKEEEVWVSVKYRGVILLIL